MLAPVVEIVIAEISVFPFGHIPKTTIGGEVRAAAAPVWVIAAWIVVRVVAAKARLVVDATTAYIGAVGEIAAVGNTGTAEVTTVKAATTEGAFVLRYRTESSAEIAVDASSTEAAKAMITTAAEGSASAESSVSESAAAAKSAVTAAEAVETTTAATATETVESATAATAAEAVESATASTATETARIGRRYHH